MDERLVSGWERPKRGISDNVCIYEDNVTRASAANLNDGTHLIEDRAVSFHTRWSIDGLGRLDSEVAGPVEGLHLDIDPNYLHVHPEIKCQRGYSRFTAILVQRGIPSGIIIWNVQNLLQVVSEGE